MRKEFFLLFFFFKSLIREVFHDGLFMQLDELGAQNGTEFVDGARMRPERVMDRGKRKFLIKKRNILFNGQSSHVRLHTREQS